MYGLFRMQVGFTDHGDDLLTVVRDALLARGTAPGCVCVDGYHCDKNPWVRDNGESTDNSCAGP